MLECIKSNKGLKLIKIIFEDVLARISKHIGTTKRKDIAKSLDTHTHTLYTWIERKSIPDKHLCKFADANNLSVDWLRRGIGKKFLREGGMTEEFVGATNG